MPLEAPVRRAGRQGSVSPCRCCAGVAGRARQARSSSAEPAADCASGCSSLSDRNAAFSWGLALVGTCVLRRVWKHLAHWDRQQLRRRGPEFSCPRCSQGAECGGAAGHVAQLVAGDSRKEPVLGSVDRGWLPPPG